VCESDDSHHYRRVVVRAVAVAKAAKKKPRAKKKVLARKKPRPPSPAAKKRGREVLERLARAMPEPRCELDHHDAWQLVVATILSAQSTDKMVNWVTPKLFARWPTPQALASAPADQVETVIKPTGFFRNKTKSIVGAARLVVERFGGEVPRTMDEMLEIPGVARKTANVVLGTAYRVVSGVVVDTHVTRVSQLLRLTKHQEPAKIEQDLMAVFPEASWIDMGHRFVLHGRYTCTARAPHCAHCPLAEICPSRREAPFGSWAERADAERETVASRGARVPW
jgi:endonuclease III